MLRSHSIVSFLGLGISLPLEIGGIVLLCVPSIVRVHHVIAPSHDLSVFNRVDKSSEVLLLVVQLVMSTFAPSHEGALVVTPATKVQRPAIAIVTFARRVTVQVLALTHVNTSNFVALLLTIPRV